MTTLRQGVGGGERRDDAAARALESGFGVGPEKDGDVAADAAAAGAGSIAGVDKAGRFGNHGGGPNDEPSTLEDRKHRAKVPAGVK